MGVIHVEGKKMKKVRNMNVKLTYYARETHCTSNSL